MNKKNPDVILTEIVKLVANVLKSLEAEGHDVERLWQRIDRAIVSTILTSVNFLKERMDLQCPKVGIQRCFQILGFDVLLDKDLNPYILEVNYRPSLETNALYERKMKMSMLSDAMQIMQPAPEFQEYINSHYSEELASNWQELMIKDPILGDAIYKTNTKPVQSFGGFILAYPTESERQMKKWEAMQQFVSSLSSTIHSKYFLPASQ